MNLKIVSGFALMLAAVVFSILSDKKNNELKNTETVK